MKKMTKYKIRQFLATAFDITLIVVVGIAVFFGVGIAKSFIIQFFNSL